MIRHCPYCKKDFERERYVAEDDMVCEVCSECWNLILDYDKLHPVLTDKQKIEYMKNLKNLEKE